MNQFFAGSSYLKFLVLLVYGILGVYGPLSSLVQAEEAGMDCPPSVSKASSFNRKGEIELLGCRVVEGLFGSTGGSNVVMFINYLAEEGENAGATIKIFNYDLNSKKLGSILFTKTALGNEIMPFFHNGKKTNFLVADVNGDGVLDVGVRGDLSFSTAFTLFSYSASKRDMVSIGGTYRRAFKGNEAHYDDSFIAGYSKDSVKVNGNKIIIRAELKSWASGYPDNPKYFTEIYELSRDGGCKFISSDHPNASIPKNN